MRIRIVLIGAITIGLAGTLTNRASAGVEETGARRIIQIGCSRGEQPGGECFVTLEGAPFGPAECRSAQARWAPQKENGRSLLALLMAAWAGDERVNVALEGTCWVQPSSGARWPWVGWVNVYHLGDVPR